MSSLLGVENLSKRFGGLQAVADVSLDVTSGEICSVIGPNGAGKSTLLKAMSGILYTEEGVIENGSIRFRNEDVHRLAPDELVRRGIVQVPEGRRVFPALTIDENLQMGGYTKTAAEARKRREKGLTHDSADRQKKNGDDKFNPFRRDRHRRWLAARSRPRHNQRNDLGLPRSVAPSDRFSISCCHRIIPPESSQISAA